MQLTACCGCLASVKQAAHSTQNCLAELPVHAHAPPLGEKTCKPIA
jgi:hypothetical protein